MQLFTHLLSSYLQGMGDFFSALPRGGGSFLLCLKHLRGASAPWGGLGRGFRRVGEGLSEGWGGAYSHKKTGEPTVTVGIPG